jgi:hypothetical protein
MRQESAMDQYEDALYRLGAIAEPNLRALYDALRMTLPPGYPLD